MEIHETAYGMSLMINNLGNICNETQLAKCFQTSLLPLIRYNSVFTHQRFFLAQIANTSIHSVEGYLLYFYIILS